MAGSRKRTLRLEVDLSLDARGSAIFNYRELAEKALAASDSAEDTPPESPQPPLSKSARSHDHSLPNFRRKNASWNIPDFRALADGYEQDSFIDDSEMCEESIPDSLKDLGYRIRSYASAHSDTESESLTLSGRSSLSESDSDSASVIELDDSETPKVSVARRKAKPVKTKENPKKYSEQNQWSEFLKRLGQNTSMEIITINGLSPAGGPRRSPIQSTPPRAKQPPPPPAKHTPVPPPPPSPTPVRPRTAPRTPPRAPTPQLPPPHPLPVPPPPPLVDASLRTPTKNNRDPTNAMVSPRAIIMVDLCNSPQKKEAAPRAAAGDLPSSPARSTSSSVGAAAPPQTAAVTVAAAPDRPADSPPVVSSSAPGSCSPDSAFASSSTDVSPMGPASPPEAPALAVKAKLGSTSKRAGGTTLSAKAANSVSSGKRSQSVEPFKRSKQPKLPPTVAALLEEAISKHAADGKWKREKQDDVLLKLGEACRELPAMDRMFVYERMADHWRISPKKISRRFSRLRSTSDKQPVKDCLSRLNALLIAESKEGVSYATTTALSPKIVELVSAALRAQSRWLQRHPPRKGGAAEALEGFARGELLALWAAGSPGAAAYGPRAHLLAAAAIECELQAVVPALAAAVTSAPAPASAPASAPGPRLA